MNEDMVEKSWFICGREGDGVDWLVMMDGFKEDEWK